MYQKVLIAEDIDTISVAMKITLQQLEVEHIDFVKYCDDAVLKIKKGLLDDQPYDLFITDLSFEADHRSSTISSGAEAIETIRQLQPELKILVYSIEDRPQIIKNLIDEHHINAYVQKGRNSIEHLVAAVQQLPLSEECYLSPSIKSLFHDNKNRQIDHFDIQLLQHLARGYSQDDISLYFSKKGIKPNSRSALEKRIAHLKDQFKANNVVHLIAISKDLGIV